MTYNPITEEAKQQWIDWLRSQVSVLNGKPENENFEVPEETSKTIDDMNVLINNRIFKTPEGDVATGKDLVGNFLATLTNQPVTID
jgi:hypothetical protein